MWISPDSANLNEGGGGLVVWKNGAAPLSWDWSGFNNYSGDQDRVEAFLKDAEQVNIPFKQNRAVIFNGNIFHRSDAFHFKRGYKNRRMNLTWLFGRRGQTPSRGTEAATAAEDARTRAIVNGCEACHRDGQVWCWAAGEDDEEEEGTACPGACVGHERGACACGASAHHVSLDDFERRADVQQMATESDIQIGCRNDRPFR